MSRSIISMVYVLLGVALWICQDGTVVEARVQETETASFECYFAGNPKPGKTKKIVLFKMKPIYEQIFKQSISST